MVNIIIALISTLFSATQIFATPNTLKITLDRHQAQLSPDQKKAINSFLTNYHNQKVCIKGHSEEGGSTQYNLILSHQRAQNALEQVLLNHVPKSMVYTQELDSNHQRGPTRLMINHRYITINLMEEPL